jgi:alpha-glucuronidase
MDRTVATGTGYIGQYPPAVAAMYTSLKTCPDNLLLFMHHVPYTYRLHTGKTVIQTLYDDHYLGAQEAAGFVTQWKSLDGLIDPERYEKILGLLEYQAGHAIVWRDSIDRWFEKMSGIPDDQHRIDHDPNRIVASAMQLDGYKPVDVEPWESASGGKAYVCDGSSCSASVHLDRPAGWYSVAVQYFAYRRPDTNFVVHPARFNLMLNRQILGTWFPPNDLPGKTPNGDTSTRFTLHGVPLRPGDTLTLEGIPDQDEPAPIDYIAVTPEPPQSNPAPGKPQ